MAFDGDGLFRYERRADVLAPLIKTLPPAEARQTADMFDRHLQELEDWLERQPTPRDGAVPEVPFVQAGAVVVGRSPRWRNRVGPAVVYEVAVTLGTAGTTATVFGLELNGTTVVTVTVPAATTVLDVPCNVAVAADERLSVNVTTAGAAAADLTVQVRVTYP